MFDKQKDEEQGDDGTKPADWSGVTVGALLLPVFLVFTHEGKEDIGLNVVTALGGIVLALKARWRLRDRSWFWGVVVLIAVLNVPLVLVIRWPHGWVPGIVLMPIALTDYLITIWAIDLTERSIEKDPS